MYENLRKSGRRKPATILEATELRTTERHYENLRIGNTQSDGRIINEDNNGKNIQWKDLSKKLRYTICALSLALFLLCSVAVTAVVLIHFLKGEEKYDSGGAWSNWEGWGPCSASCGAGVKIRSRNCTNPRPSKLGTGCYGNSVQVVLCNKQTCCDHKVLFLAYGSTKESSGTTFYVVKFPFILLNSGNGYNPSTGRFTCKIPGMYNFAVTVKKRRQLGCMNTILRVNGINKLQDDNCVGSVTGNFRLNKNDFVDVCVDSNGLKTDLSTSFTGILIPDYCI